MNFELIRALIGTWRLVATSAVDDAGLANRAPYGPDPQGIVSFGANGRMMCVLCDGRADLPPGEAAREYNSYCGAFEFDGDTLVTRVDGSSNPAWVGGDQVRQVRFEGARVVLRNGRRTLVWERLV
jgi:Lipocalin-like domain